MFNNNMILVVIPARGGSKGIPRKNLRLLHNKPLISYSIGVAKQSQYVDDVVVTTDDSQIALIAEKFGASVVRRSQELSTDDVLLDPVIHDAMIQKEKLAFDEYDIVITLQPTSPLIKPETLDKVIEKFDDFSIDSVISVVDDRHLSWGYDENNNRYFPTYIERVAKKDLPKSFRETGAILATRRSFVHENSRLGTNIDIVEVAPEESVNIEKYEDWWLAENYLMRKNIAMIVDANDEIGTAHIDRCISLASKLVFHNILFLVKENHQLAINTLDKLNYSFKTYEDYHELFDILNKFNSQIIVNDILDTSEEYILTLKEQDYFVVNFEDLGVGMQHADVVFDDLYEHDMSEENVYTGYKYFVLKDEFYYQPSKIIKNEVNKVLINFRGNDQQNLTEMVIDSILSTNYEGRIDVIVGVGYNDLEGLISKYESNPLIQIYQNVSNVSEFMFNSDLIFTSNNRSLYEICSIGVPTIVISQNDREASHTFANINNGFVNLGLGEYVNSQKLIEEFVKLVNDYELRLNLHSKMKSFNLKNGYENILSVVEEEYRKFEFNKDLN